MVSQEFRFLLDRIGSVDQISQFHDEIWLEGT